MKYTNIAASLAVFALVNDVSATRVSDMFDAYDEETKKEASMKNREENVDAKALAKEIDGDSIKREVKAATAGVADQTMLQLDANIRLGGVQRVYVPEEGIFIQREITDKDGDGVEDNVYYKHHELDKFYKPAVYRTAEEMHNTRNGELPGHHLKEDHPVPERHNSDIIKGSEAEEKAALKA